MGVLFIVSLLGLYATARQESQPVTEPLPTLLKLLNITPSAESIDYIQNKTQFQLHTLLTEQRHPKTWNLSERIQQDYEAGLHMLFSVDEDISKTIERLIRQKGPLDNAVQAVEEALISGNTIYIYGCGATGRLAKQMESAFWRPFWKRTKENKKIWTKIRDHLRTDVEDQLIGEMTGADRALISSLEGFEDLLLIGELQLKDRGIQKGDVVICVTEGGETSSVIGTILAALAQWKAEEGYSSEQSKKKLYFIYNNPDEKLIPFDRSRKVLEEPGITKINLTTGPQAITGSTRMQATTIETFVIGNILQTAIEHTLHSILSRKEMARLGFSEKISLEKKLSDFPSILRKVQKSVPAIAKFTRLESETYETRHFSTYFSQKGLITVFIDSTERSPTFRLSPLDTIKEKGRRCWIQVWTPAANLQEAWQAFLGRPFRGLASEFYREPFEQQISDPFLKKAALESLKNAGDNQQFLYDFSFSESNIQNRGPKEGDLGVVVLLSPEEKKLLDKNSEARRFIDLFLKKGSRVAIVFASDQSEKHAAELTRFVSAIEGNEDIPLVVIPLENETDPFGLNLQIALKMVLNAHSTAVMARLGKVIGNTMTNVSPSNLKLIGRATYLIQSHVNDMISRPEWVKRYGIRKPISYGEANAVLFEAIGFLKDKQQEGGQTAEVALSIIRILESLRLQKGISLEEAFMIVKDKGLSKYLAGV